MMAKMTASACLCAGMLFVALTGSADVMSEIRKACFEGADTRIVFRVVDDDGLAVSNATVDVLFDMVDRSKATRKVGATGSDGVCALESLSGGQIKIKVSKVGYYETSDQMSFVSADNELMAERVKNGRWLPWGASKELILRPVKKPTAVRVGCGLWRYAVVMNEWIGFDIQRYDFVAPYGSGVVSDFDVRFDWDGKWKVREFSGIGVEIRFPEKYSGAYYQPLVLNSEFKGVYKADANAVYQQSFAFSSRAIRDRMGRIKEYAGDKFDTKMTLVVRSRCICDEQGELKSACYSQLSNFRFVASESGAGIIFNGTFNASPNNTNLEPKR